MSKWILQPVLGSAKSFIRRSSGTGTGSAFAVRARGHQICVTLRSRSLGSCSPMKDLGLLKVHQCQHTHTRNAGHSKWQNIMHIKMDNDAKKAAIRAKIAAQMKIAIREGGSADPKANKKLADIIEIAKNNQVPAENIQRVLTDSKNAKDLKFVHHALKGPGQSVLIVELETDNHNRTRQEIAAVIKRKGFVLCEAASVMYLFQYVGVILCSEHNNVKVGEKELDVAVEHAIEAGAIDVNLRESGDEYGTVLEFKTDPAPNTFYPVIGALQDLNYKVVHSELEYIPLTPIEVPDSQIETISWVCNKLSSIPGLIRISDNIA